MLTSDSMSLLWLTYLGLSLIVLVSGYLGLAFLPRLLRLPITWAVAGILWMPTRFRLPLVEEGEFYTGMAPAVVVAAIAVLERNASVLMSSGLLVAAGALLGMALGILQVWLLRAGGAPEQEAKERNRDERKGRKQDNNRRREGHGGGQPHAPRKRREPRVG
ncbi:hypothetical protein ACOJCM_02670 [Billgrantia sp. LNSP4103-1]|uniref:hypothetical protein n=1 Tax=Billgrantia sp. LNSP4103-1 TaxID=3410266 RepID=UPI00403F084C